MRERGRKRRDRGSEIERKRGTRRRERKKDGRGERVAKRAR